VEVLVSATEAFFDAEVARFPRDPQQFGAKARFPGSSTEELKIVLIEPRALQRECLAISIGRSHPQTSLQVYGSVEAWRSAETGHDQSVIIVGFGARRMTAPSTRAELVRIVEGAAPTPVIVLAESEDLRDMAASLEAGARGFIPESVSIAVMVHATRLAVAGGVFLPATNVLTALETQPDTVAAPGGGAIEQMFTKRQAAVADSLRRGRANKLIAYQLNMCESTVKVHIRTIMKRLKATNRTEAAYKLNALFPPEDGATP
jgi:DNA-binding NarL/FixJ family response regulator